MTNSIRAITVSNEALTAAQLHDDVAMAPVTSGAQTALETLIYEDPITKAAVWQCEPGIYPRSKTGQSSIQYILSGAATIVDADGTEHSVNEGMVLITPDGWQGTWYITDTVRKFFVHTYAPTEA